MTPRKRQGSTASAAFALRTREVREAKGWRQEDLAERLEEIGHPIGRSNLAKLEQGRRRVSLDDAVAIAAALGPSFVEMILPQEPDVGVDIGSRWQVTAHLIRAWVEGSMPLRDEDWQAFLDESSHAEDVRANRGARAMRELVAAFLHHVDEEDDALALDALADLRDEVNRTADAIKRRQRRS